MSDSYRQSVVHVEKVARGVPAESLPVEQPTRFELVVNLKTARALGVTIPQSVLAMTDMVIDP